MPIKRTLCLVDAENLYYTPKQRWGPKAKVDFSKLYRRITGGQPGAKAIAYVVADPVVDQSRFLKRLAEIGFIPKVKVLYSDRGRFRNSNWDDEIIADGLALLPETDHLVLVSGDGDFSGLLQAYREQGKPISVFCFEDDFSPLLKEADTVSFLDQRILMTQSGNRFHQLPECRFPMQSILFEAASM